MTDYKETPSGLLLPRTYTGDAIPDALARESVVSASVVTTSGFRTPTGTVLIPEETKQYGFRRVKLEDLNELPRARAINHLIQNTDSLRFAVDTYRDYSVQDFTIDAEEDSDFQIIDTFIDNFPKGRAGFLNYLKQLAYGRYVEGGIASELVNDDSGMPTKTVYVSPWTLAAELRSTPEIGEYYIYGQRKRGGGAHLREEDILEDEANPTNRFIYLPAHQNGDDPFGSSQVTPALFSISSMQDLLSNIVNFVQGQVFPKHVYSIDTKALADAGYTPAQISQAAKLATDLLTNTLNAADITEDVILSVPIVATLVGSLEKSGIDGAEMIIDIFERQQQRGLKVPRVLYGSRRSGSGLNDNESRVEWFAFFKRLYSGMTDIEAVADFHFDEILAIHGSLGSAHLRLSRDDPELKRYAAELFKMEMEGFAVLQKLGVLTREELRRKVIESQPAFNDLDMDLPEELKAMDAMALTGMQAMAGGSNGSDDSEGGNNE